MAGELDGINSNSLLLASLQSASISQMRNQKTEKSKETGSAKRTRFSDVLKTSREEEAFSTLGLPPEVQGMSLDEAAVFLRDAVDNAGNALSQQMTLENLSAFKKAVSQFVRFVVENNFEEQRQDDPRVARAKRLHRPEPTLQPVHVFSTYNNQPQKIPQKVLVQVINEKMDQITRDMLQTQSDNLKILKEIDEIKGLVVDLLHG